MKRINISAAAPMLGPPLYDDDTNEDTDSQDDSDQDEDDTESHRGRSWRRGRKPTVRLILRERSRGLNNIIF